MTPGKPVVEWVPFDYRSVPLPTEDAEVRRVSRPAVFVRVRRHDQNPWVRTLPNVQLDGIVDSGADMSVVPLWELRHIGATFDEGSRRSVYGVAGNLHVYDAKIGLGIKRDRSWLDVGTVDVCAPDTKWSRDPSIAWPFVLGPGGFFDRFDVCISHSRKEFWLGKIGGWA